MRKQRTTTTAAVSRQTSKTKEPTLSIDSIVTNGESKETTKRIPTRSNKNKQIGDDLNVSIKDDGEKVLKTLKNQPKSTTNLTTVAATRQRKAATKGKDVDEKEIPTSTDSVEKPKSPKRIRGATKVATISKDKKIVEDLFLPKTVDNADKSSKSKSNQSSRRNRGQKIIEEAEEIDLPTKVSKVVGSDDDYGNAPIFKSKIQPTTSSTTKPLRNRSKLLVASTANSNSNDQVAIETSPKRHRKIVADKSDKMAATTTNLNDQIEVEGSEEVRKSPKRQRKIVADKADKMAAANTINSKRQKKLVSNDEIVDYLDNNTEDNSVGISKSKDDSSSKCDIHYGGDSVGIHKSNGVSVPFEPRRSGRNAARVIAPAPIPIPSQKKPPPSSRSKPKSKESTKEESTDDENKMATKIQTESSNRTSKRNRPPPVAVSKVSKIESQSTTTSTKSSDESLKMVSKRPNSINITNNKTSKDSSVETDCKPITKPTSKRSRKGTKSDIVTEVEEKEAILSKIEELKENGHDNLDQKVEITSKSVVSKRDKKFEKPEIVEINQPSSSSEKIQIENTKIEAKIEKNLEISPNKRKLDTVSTCIEHDSSKRIRNNIQEIEKFDFDSVGNLFTFGEGLCGELGPRLVRLSSGKVDKNEPSLVKLMLDDDLDEDDLDDEDSKSPVPGSLVRVRHVACGAYHTMVLTADGTVVSFGCKDDAALGRVLARPEILPELMMESDEETVPEDDQEYEERMAAKPQPLIEIKSKVSKVCAGEMHGAALTENGLVYVWGNFKCEDSCKIGMFVDDLQDSDQDYLPTILPRLVELDNHQTAIDIASGSNHLLILATDGTVYSFGDGSKGQLGRIDCDNLGLIKSNRKLFLKPGLVQLSHSNDLRGAKIFASHWFSYAVTTDGALYAWGLNNYHQLGFRTEKLVELNVGDYSVYKMNMALELVPRLVRFSSKIAKVTNGQQHQLLLDQRGNLYSCGSALYGKLGHGEEFTSLITSETDDKCLSQPMKIASFQEEDIPIVDIGCSDFGSFAITAGGQCYRWGQGVKHIGIGTEDDFVPKPVTGSYARSCRFWQISCGAQFVALIGSILEQNGNDDDDDNGAAATTTTTTKTTMTTTI